MRGEPLAQEVARLSRRTDIERRWLTHTAAPGKVPLDARDRLDQPEMSATEQPKTEAPPLPAPRDPGLREMANAIRALSMDAVEKAKSGHPGMPMGMAEIGRASCRERV